MHSPNQVSLIFLIFSVLVVGSHAATVTVSATPNLVWDPHAITITQGDSVHFQGLGSPTQTHRPIAITSADLGNADLCAAGNEKTVGTWTPSFCSGADCTVGPFDDIGTINFKCSFHCSGLASPMTGSITVVAPSPQATTTHASGDTTTTHTADGTTTTHTADGTTTTHTADGTTTHSNGETTTTTHTTTTATSTFFSQDCLCHDVVPNSVLVTFTSTVGDCDQFLSQLAETTGEPQSDFCFENEAPQTRSETVAIGTATSSASEKILAMTADQQSTLGVADVQPNTSSSTLLSLSLVTLFSALLPYILN